MLKIYAPKFLRDLLFLSITLVVYGCGATKTVPYFQNVTDSGTTQLSEANQFKDPTIQADDILSISIFTIDPKTSLVVNQLSSQSFGQGQSISANTSLSASGFLVDKNGEIELSVIGKVSLLGLTTFQARDLIQQKASITFNSPNVQVRFSNFKVTVLGEVNRPATYTVPNEKLTILDALGLAGDLTIYGRRDNVMLIRASDHERKFARLNLNSTNLFNSPYFYLKQNDVIYIEPNKSKAAALNSARTQFIAITGTIISVLITVISKF
jgi:polysaccharide export outer membrane protein